MLIFCGPVTRASDAGKDPADTFMENQEDSLDVDNLADPADPIDDVEDTEQEENSEVIDANLGFDLEHEVRRYQIRYALKSLSQKLIDNRGRGPKALFGTRNFRVVLPGVLYRGGANNVYLKHPRSNINPLPTVGLKDLCKEDFSTAVYLYSEHFSRAPHYIVCKNSSHRLHSLNYKQYAAAGENKKILGLVYKRIKGQLKGPIYTHCWNGWHSSGLISAMALKQFCGWSDAKADAYWTKNTDGNFLGYSRIRARLRNFKPYAKYAITDQERALICPKE